MYCKGDKVPVVITMIESKKHIVVDVDIFSSIEKAEAHFLFLCVDMELSYRDYDSPKHHWYVSHGGKTVYIEWRELQ
jgi:hypothetical protein